MAVSPKKGSADSRPSIKFPHVITVLFLCLLGFLSTKLDRHSTNRSNAAQGNTLMGVRSDPMLSFWEGMDGEFSPQIVWLMSFPNSGTSYTMTTMEEASNYSTATNYGAEVTAKGRYSLSIYPRHPEGPFWEGLSGELGTIRYLPPKYVLVKTHCGSRCVKCSPSGYMQTLENFAIACRNTTARIPQADHRTGFQYPVAWVKKAIHLIRDPFSNIVSRFHHERKNFVQKKNDEWLTKYPDNPKGFQQWCADNDKDSELDEFQTFEYDLLKAVQLAPCHGEVFKFVQWHNLAFALTEKFSIETKVLLYEDFEEHFDETIESLLRFMEFPQARAPRQFSAKGSYSDYYSHVDRRRIGLLVKKIATKETWKHLERYILDID